MTQTKTQNETHAKGISWEAWHVAKGQNCQTDKKPPTCKETELMKNGDAELEVRQEFNQYTAL